MRIVDIITTKRDGGELSQEEIEFFIRGYVAGDVPDYQAAAFCMAVFFRGMTPEETTHLTEAMAFSGETLDLHDVAPFIVDKHSSGGVGDKTTLVVGPMVASLGVPVGKMSGRGLSFSGGTLDKLESIPGFNVNLTIEQFKRQLRDDGRGGRRADARAGPGRRQALRAARRHRHGAFAAADRQLDHVEEDRRRRRRHRARRQGWARRVHGDAAAGGRAGEADGADRPRAGAQDDGAASAT